MAPATVSGFIIPDGDSFPRTTTTHSVVAPPNNVASDLDPIPSASITTSHTVTSSTTATATPITDGSSSTPFPPAAIAGIVLAILTIIGIIFFFVRRHFIHKRASKITPARARSRAASQVAAIAISGPTGFQHVSSADGNAAPVWNNEDKVSMNAQVGRGIPQPMHEKPGKGETNESANKEKYTVNFGEMESGLHDHVRAMQFARQDSF